MTHVNQDVSTENFAEFAAANDVDFHDGDKLKLHVWVGNLTEMERLATISWTGDEAVAIVNYNSEEATDYDRDTFWLEAVISGLQQELDRRARFNFDELPEAAKALIEASAARHPAGGYEELARERPRNRAEELGICCEASRGGGKHDHGTFTVDLA